MHTMKTYRYGVKSWNVVIMCHQYCIMGQRRNSLYIYILVSKHVLYLHYITAAVCKILVLMFCGHSCTYATAHQQLPPVTQLRLSWLCCC